MPTNAVFASYVPDTLTFTDGLAWGAIAGDRTPARGSVDIALSVPNRRIAFAFDFPGTRLDSSPFARQLTGWQWRDSNGAGFLTTPSANAPHGIYSPGSVYGVESYDNSAGVSVEAAYWSVADN